MRHDPSSGRWTLEVDRTRGRRVVAPGTLEIDGTQSDVFEIVDGHPLSAEVTCRRTMGMRRDGWSAHVETTTRMSGDRCDFVLEHEIEAFENGERVFSRSGSLRIPRDLV